MTKFWFTIILFGIVFLTGCGVATNSTVITETNQPEQVQTSIQNEVVSPTKTATMPLSITPIKEIAVTYNHLDGNRIVAGKGGFSTQALEADLENIPEWIVGVALDHKSIFYVVLVDGSVQAFELENNLVIREIQTIMPNLPPDAPPLLVSDGNTAYLIEPPLDASPFTHPIMLENGSLFFIDRSGNLNSIHSKTTVQLPVNALPDARILTDDVGRMLFLSDPTSDYQHGVLGDALEARSITLIDPNRTPVKSKKIMIDADDVIEGIAPLWVDLDGDGAREIIVTQSNANVGARIVVYNQEGDVLAQSNPIGQGFRWLHLIAAAQLINNNTLEIIVVRTPHIGGVLEVYEIKDDRLEMNSSIKGFSSHKIGSRNLDSSLVSDVNGDGIPDVVLPDQSQQFLSALQLTNTEWKEIWKEPLNAKLTTNIIGVYSSNMGLILASGSDAKKIMFWILKDS